MVADEDVDEAVAAVARATGRQVVASSPVAGSVANLDLVVDLDDGRRVLAKVGPADELVGEAWACRRLHGLGVPVPPVVALEHAPAAPGTALLVLGFVVGEASTEAAVVREAGAALRRVHALHLPGRGTLVPRADGSAAGAHRTWDAALRADLEGIDRVVEAGVLDGRLARTAVGLVLADGGPCAYDGPGVLLHRDLKVQHLFGVGTGAGAHLSAVIDWGFVGVGDPELDLARLSMAGPEVLGAFLEGYGREPDPGLGRRLARYRIWWDLSTLVYEHAAGSDWFEVYRSRVATDVALLTEG